MRTTTRTSRAATGTLLLAAAIAACDGEGNPTPIGPGPGEFDEVYVLNSTGQTIASFDVDDAALSVLDAPIDQGPSFDGAKMDVNDSHAVTTVSSFGGSAVLFSDLETGDVSSVAFPGSQPLLANPGRPTFDGTGVAWFGARGRDAIYSAMPGDAEATLLVEDVGTFVEAVVPVGAGGLAAIDAYIDDAGGTFTPFGPSRVFLLTESGAVLDTLDLPTGALNALDGVLVSGRLIVLLGGTLDPLSFQPRRDGGLVSIDLETRTVGPLVPLNANGVSIEAGADGLVYVTTTTNFVTLRALSFDPGSGDFVAGPDAPLDLRATNGGSLSCWVVTALEDGRMLCASFATVERGRLHLLDEDGAGLDWINSGFGSSDVVLR